MTDARAFQQRVSQSRAATVSQNGIAILFNGSDGALLEEVKSLARCAIGAGAPVAEIIVGSGKVNCIDVYVRGQPLNAACLVSSREVATVLGAATSEFPVSSQ